MHEPNTRWLKHFLASVLYNFRSIFRLDSVLERKHKVMRYPPPHQTFVGSHYLSSNVWLLVDLILGNLRCPFPLLNTTPFYNSSTHVSDRGHFLSTDPVPQHSQHMAVSMRLTVVANQGWHYCLACLRNTQNFWKRKDAAVQQFWIELVAEWSRMVDTSRPNTI
jgi:hypothetical protein